MFHNLFTFAPGELTGSAFWAWILQSLLCQHQNNKTELARLAKKILAFVDIDPQQITDVDTEVKCEKEGRADIVLYDQNKKPFLIIENKVWSTPNADDIKKQIERYAKSLNQPDIKMLAMSWRYDTECLWGEDSEIKLLTLKDQCELLEGINHPIVEEYASHAKIILAQRQQDLEKVKKEYPVNEIVKSPSERNKNNRILDYYDVQWCFLNMITKNIKDIKLYNGNSRGRPWTQAGFKIDGKSFFYRLDRSKEGFYLRLNYYTQQKQDKTEYINRLTSLNLPKPDWLEWKPSYLKGKESTLWYAWLKNVDMPVNDFKPQLEEFHKEFIKKLGA